MIEEEEDPRGGLDPWGFESLDDALDALGTDGLVDALLRTLAENAPLATEGGTSAPPLPRPAWPGRMSQRPTRERG